MLGAKLTPNQRRMTGKFCHEHKIGFFNEKYKSKRAKWARKGVETQQKEKVGIYNKNARKKYASLGGKAGSKSQMKSGSAIFNKSKRSEWAKLGGLSLKGMMCVSRGNERTRIRPDELQKFISNGYVLGWGKRTPNSNPDGG